MDLSEVIIADLRNSGYRITPQREMIIRTLAKRRHHMQVDEIHSELQQQTNAINVATVYRTLEMLWEEGFVFRNDLHEGKIVYAIAEHGPHVHLVCRRCKDVIDIDPEVVKPLRDTLQQDHGFTADLEHLSVSGICVECAR